MLFIYSTNGKKLYYGFNLYQVFPIFIIKTYYISAHIYFRWLEEYEKSQMDIDWSTIEAEDNVICPICQKNNLVLTNSVLSCSQCQSTIKTQKSLPDVKKSILYSLEKHSAVCNNEFQFALVPELNESHIYLICSSCLEMQIVV